MRDNDKVRMDGVFRAKRDNQPRPVRHNVRRDVNLDTEPKDSNKNTFHHEEKEEIKPMPKSKPKKMKSNSKQKKIAIIVVCVVVLGLIGWSVYSFIMLNNVQTPEYVEQQSQQEAENLTNKVSKLIELPEGEPVVATVSDKEKLSDQPFFNKAENGDKVLIWADSSMAIIYRESENKIINSGPIAITSEEGNNETTPLEAN